jgi:hypothetical protein
MYRLLKGNVVLYPLFLSFGCIVLYYMIWREHGLQASGYNDVEMCTSGMNHMKVLFIVRSTMCSIQHVCVCVIEVLR